MGAFRSSAFRLKHDLGKGVVFSAPGAPEADPEALRSRLARDLLATRRGAGGEALDATAVYDRWKAGPGAVLETPETRADLDALEAAVGELRRLLPGLATLESDGLLALDRAARAIAARCAALHRTAVALEGDA